jgi:hypothetical protein
MTIDDEASGASCFSSIALATFPTLDVSPDHLPTSISAGVGREHPAQAVSSATPVSKVACLNLTHGVIAATDKRNIRHRLVEDRDPGHFVNTSRL